MSLLPQLEELFHQYIGNKWFVLKTSLIAIGFSLFFQFPNISYLKQQLSGEIPYDYWGIMLQIKQEPFKKLELGDSSHAAKKSLRLTFPMLAKVFHLNTRLSLYLAICAFTVLLMVLLTVFTFKFTNNKPITFLATIAFACTYLGASGFTDVTGLTVVVGYFFLLAALTFRSPILIFLSLFMAAWADERALINSSFVFIWWIMLDTDFQKVTLRHLFKVNTKTLAIVGAWAAFFVTRFLLDHFYNMSASSGGLDMEVFKQMTPKLSLSFWSAFEGMWIIGLLFLIILWHNKHYFLLTIVCLAFVIGVAPTFLVRDTTKTVTHAFPFILIAIPYLSRYMNRSTLVKQLATIAIICVIAPTIYRTTEISVFTSFWQEVILSLVN